MFVEAHTVGKNDWTTLPDRNGHTSQSTGPNDPDLASCPGRLDVSSIRGSTTTRRTTRTGSCTPTGTDRRLERSHGQVDRLGAVVDQPRRLRGKTGRDLDRVRERLVDSGARCVRGRHHHLERRDDVIRGPASTAGRRRGPPQGSAAEHEQLDSSTTSDGFPEGAAIPTPDSIYFGFGLEGISTPSTRNAVMGRAMDFLLDRPDSSRVGG